MILGSLNHITSRHIMYVYIYMKHMNKGRHVWCNRLISRSVLSAVRPAEKVTRSYPPFFHLGAWHGLLRYPAGEFWGVPKNFHAWKKRTADDHDRDDLSIIETTLNHGDHV